MRGGFRYKVITYSPLSGEEIDRDEGLTPQQALTLAMKIREGEGGFIVHIRPPLPENILMQGRNSPSARNTRSRSANRVPKSQRTPRVNKRT